MRFRFVSFDLNGIILKPARPVGEIYSSAARNYGFEVSPSALETNFHKSMKVMSDSYKNFGSGTIGWQEWWKKVVCMTFKASMMPGEFDRMQFEPFANNLLKLYETKQPWELCEGSREILHSLKTSSVLVGAITNSDPRVKLILEDFGLINNFNFIINSYDAATKKPDKAIFVMAEKYFEVHGSKFKKKEAVHIGDSFSKDYQGARNAGWNALLVSQEIDSLPDDVKKSTFKDLFEVLNYFKR